MQNEQKYTTQLQAGLGLVDEISLLLSLWSDGESASVLYQKALRSGRFGTITARRLRNIVVECFAPRFLRGTPYPALLLKIITPHISQCVLRQLIFIYTARANLIFADFVRQIFWSNYAGGMNHLSTDRSKKFIRRAIEDGKTTSKWSDSTVRRVASYLIGCCADFGLLEKVKKPIRSIQHFRIDKITALYLAYDLHIKGFPDNSMMAHEDWLLFGLNPSDVREELRQIGSQGHLLLQSAGKSVRIEWKYQTMEEMANVLIEK